MPRDNMIVEKLTEEVAKAEADLKAKTLLLQLAKKQANKKYFIETRFGKLCLKAVAGSTRPAAQLHAEAMVALESPRLVIAEHLTKEAVKLLEKAKSFEDNSTKKAWKLALAMADLKAEIEELAADAGFIFNFADQVNALKVEINRLRPTRDPEVQKQIEGVVSQAVEAVASSLSAGVNDGVQAA